MKKLTFRVLMVCLVLIGMATAAMAFQVVNRSAEMIANSPCDRAGTIQMFFQSTDYVSIGNWLNPEVGNHKYAEIRIALNGLEVEPGSDAPLLCKTISGTAVVPGVPNSGKLLKLTPGVGVSNIFLDPDVDIYVYGAQGDQIIHVYITKLNAPFGQINWSDNSQIPWFSIGLYEELLPGPTTSICADVHNFSGFAKLTISNESLPADLEFSGDNEIGHFLGQVFTQVPCKLKTQDVGCVTPTQIRVCPLAEQQFCAQYNDCIIVKGDWPATNEVVALEVRSNGEKSGATKQQGINLANVAFSDLAGKALTPTSLVFYDAADNVVKPTNCGFAAVRAVAKFSASVLTGVESVRICITYEVNPAAAVVGSTVHFWLNGSVEPCGTLFNFNSSSGTTLTSCGSTSGCIYFQYVLQQTPGWFTGIAITDLADTPDLAAAEFTMTLTDGAGNKFQWKKKGLPSVVYAFGLDTELAKFKPVGTAPAKPVAGAAWLKVETNFQVDGYEYITNGSYAASVLSRFCD